MGEKGGPKRWAVVPWQCWDEWVAVKDLLWSPSLADRESGVAIVDAWRQRMPLPAAIEVTGALRRELDSPAPNVWALCMAIIRLVNAVADPGVFGNGTTRGAAVERGVPEFLVQVRLTSTHGPLPSLGTARAGAEWGLTWLRESYWEPQAELIEECLRETREGVVAALVSGKGWPFMLLSSSEEVYVFGVSAVAWVLNRKREGEAFAHVRGGIEQLLSRIASRFPFFRSALIRRLVQDGAREWVEALAEGGAAEQAWLPGGVWPVTPLGQTPRGVFPLTLRADEVAVPGDDDFLEEGEEEISPPADSWAAGRPSEPSPELPRRHAELEIW